MDKIYVIMKSGTTLSFDGSYDITQYDEYIKITTRINANLKGIVKSRKNFVLFWAPKDNVECIYRSKDKQH